MQFTSNNFQDVNVSYSDYFHIKFMKQRAIKMDAVHTPYIKIVPKNDNGNNAKEYIIAKVILQENGLTHFTKKMTTT
jgi:hypothetical protein